VLLGGVAGALALLCLVRMPRARLYASGALVGIGTLLALHLAGVLVEIGKDDGVRNLRYGGALGIAGGVLLIAAGTRVIRAGQPADSPAAPVAAAS
jgi:hypothetical protein